MALNPLVQIAVNSIANTSAVSSSVINSATGGAASGIDGNSDSLANIIEAMKRAIELSVKSSSDTNAAAISGAVNAVRMQVLSSGAASSLAITNSVNSLATQIKANISSSEASLKTYIASDADIIKRMMQIQTDNVKSAYSLSERTLSLTLDRMKDQFNRQEGANLDKFKEMIVELNEGNDKLGINFREGMQAGVQEGFREVGGDLGNILEQLLERVNDIKESFKKLENGDYDTLDSFISDLVSNDNSLNVINFLWQLISFVPLIKDVLGYTQAPMFTKLQQLSMKDASPTQLSPNALIFLNRLDLLDNNDLVDLLGIQGYSKENMINLINSNRQLLGIPDLLELFRRNKFDENTLLEYLQHLGINRIDGLRLIELAHFQPTVQDVIRNVVRDVYNDEIAAQGNIFEGWDNPQYLAAAKEAGIRPIDAKNFWGSHWELPSPTQAYEMLFRGLISIEQLRSLLRSADYAPAYVDKLVSIAYRTPTRVDTRNFYYNDVIDENQLLLLIKEYGYNDTHAQYLLDYYRKGKVKFKTGKSKVKQLSISIITDSFNKGILDRNQAVARLVDIGYTHPDAEIILQESAIRIENDTNIDYSKEIQTRLKNLAEQNYRTRSISRNDAIDILKKASLSIIDINAILDLVDLEYVTDRKAEILDMYRKLYIDYEVTEEELTSLMLTQGFNASEIDKHIMEIEPLRMFRHRDLTISDIKRAYASKIINEEELYQQLASLQYSDRDIAILVKLYFGNEEIEE